MREKAAELVEIKYREYLDFHLSPNERSRQPSVPHPSRRIEFYFPAKLIVRRFLDSQTSSKDSRAGEKSYKRELKAPNSTRYFKIKPKS